MNNTPRNSRQTIVWTEVLDMTGVIYWLVLSFFRDVIVRYDEHQISQRAQKFIGLLRNSRYGGMFLPAELRLTKDDAGRSLRYVVEEAVEKSIDNYLHGFAHKESINFLRMVKTYLAAKLLYQFVFIIMAAERIKRIPDATHEIRIQGYAGNGFLVEYFGSQGLILKRRASWKAYLRVTAVPFYYIAMSLTFSKKVRLSDEEDVPVRPSVWVQYCQQEGPDFAFWSPYAHNQEYDRVFYSTDKTQKGLDAKCRAYGFRKIEYKRLYETAALNFSAILRIFQHSLARSKGKPWWFLCFCCQDEVIYRLFVQFYSKYKVKALIQYQNTSCFQDTQKRALEAVGGIMIGTHWSAYHGYPCMAILNPEHVYFVWGKPYFEWMVRNGHSSGYVLPSGMRLVSKPIEEINFDASVTFKLSIFDTRSAYWAVYQPEDVSQFYLTVFNLIERNQHFGGIVKSKFSEAEGLIELPEGHKIIEIADRLICQKRLVFLDPRTSPASAATSADLAVSAGINSAGIIAGTLDIRTVMWDCSGFLDHPIYRYADQQVLFLTLNGLVEAVVKADKGVADIGDFSRWKASFNYFCDANVPQRIADFIDEYMANVISSGNAKKSLEIAVAEYIKNNQIHADFFRFSNWWGYPDKNMKTIPDQNHGY